MKFPITRESLQAFDPVREEEEKIEEEIQKNFTKTIDIICKEFQQNMPSNSKQKRYVWQNLHLIRNLYINVQFSVGPISKKVNIDEHLPRFIEKLKETFIGCDIIIDPLKTYLIIDWS
jgi:hypothetical protein